jgi:tRNA G10  N-methylase Trm11
LKKIFEELLEEKNVRANLAALRAEIREGGIEEKEDTLVFVEAHEPLFLGFLQSEDAKTRKIAARLLGDIAYEQAVDALYEAYCAEEKLFVRSSYLTALGEFDVTRFLPEFRDRLEELTTSEVAPENRKHTDEEIRELRKILIRHEGITRHTFLMEGGLHHVLLVANREHRALVARQTGGRLHPFGVAVHTDDLRPLLQVRTYREMLFPLPLRERLPEEELWRVWEPMLDLCRKYHEEDTPFYFRIECRAGIPLDERSRFTQRLGMGIEELSNGALINSTGDYEVELRLIADKDGLFFPCLKFSTLPDERFAYRKNAIAASIHPSVAALIMELSAPYLKENAQIMDPFCGVGTMLIERDLRVPAGEKYATDIFGEAIEGARENAALSGRQIHFIHRDFFDFRHDYKFDELITNMPVRGRRTREEMDRLYTDFFEKALTLLAPEAVIILYTGESGFVKKQIRLRPELSLLQEYCMQSQKGYYLMIIRVQLASTHKN